MRLFSAILFDKATTANLVALQDELRSRAGRGNYSRPDNLHLTLAFLGDYDQLGPPTAALDDVSFAPFTLVIDRVGRGRQHGRDLWFAGVADNPALLGLRSQLASALRHRGCSFDAAPFSPHITLARQVATSAFQWPVEPFTQLVDSIYLMVSERVDGVLTYTPVHERPAEVVP